jgi:hypothetical protein
MAEDEGTERRPRQLLSDSEEEVDEKKEDEGTERQPRQLQSDSEEEVDEKKEDEGTERRPRQLQSDSEEEGDYDEAEEAPEGLADINLQEAERHRKEACPNPLASKYDNVQFKRSAQ